MLIVVTNRILCKEDFLDRLQKIINAKPNYIILREKDLSENDYYHLAKRVQKMCQENNVELIINSHINVARDLNIKNIHLPYPVFIEMAEKIESFKIIGVSVHSVEEAIKAQELRASYIMYGHIFKTDCKKGLEPRGLKNLKDICKSAEKDVFAIGGINEDNAKSVLKNGAKGICVMSEMMACEDVEQKIEKYKRILTE